MLKSGFLSHFRSLFHYAMSVCDAAITVPSSPQIGPKEGKNRQKQPQKEGIRGTKKTTIQEAMHSAWLPAWNKMEEEVFMPRP